MKNIDEFKLLPLKEYKSPKYPTYLSVDSDRLLLKKLPSRWQKNIGALACVTLLGATTILGGCFGLFNGCGCPECGSVHFGGAGVPAYVVYLTEQEAIGVIRNKAEYLGLELNDTPPDITVGDSWRETRLKLFNEEKNIALAHVGPTDRWDFWGNSWQAQNTQTAFNNLLENEDSNLTVKVLYSNGEPTRCCPSDEQRAEITQRLKAHLSAQVRDFIEFLQAEGVIQ